MQIQKTHKQNNIKINEKIHTYTIQPWRYVGHLVPGMGHALECGWCLVILLWRKLLFLFQQGSGTGNFLFRGGTPCPLLPLSSDIFPELNPCRNCVCCHCLCDTHIYQFCCAERHCFLRANFFFSCAFMCAH